MSLRITEKDVKGVAVLALDGRLIIGDPVRMLGDRITALVEEQKTKIVLNLGKVTYVDSSGAGTLVRCFSAVKAAGGSLQLAEPTEHFREILKLTRLQDILPVHDTEDEAVASLA
jgi:anti-sigma B factor antagonist